MKSIRNYRSVLVRIIYCIKIRTMFKANIKFNAREPSRYPFQINTGMDTFVSPVWNKKLVDCLNIDITDYGFKRRKWISKLWWSGVGTINWLWVIKRESWDIPIRATWIKLQKSVSWVRTDITTITDIKTEIVSFMWPNYTALPFKSGTATWGTTRTLETTWMVENDYISKYIIITWWTGVWQVKLITSNTTTTVFVEWLWQTAPDSTSTYDIRGTIGNVYITNGIDNFMQYDWTTLTTHTNIKKFHSLEVSNNRLFWAREDEDILYYSDLWVWAFPKDNFILVSQDWDKITRLKANQDRLVIYKQYSRFKLIWASPDFFQLIQNESHKWAISGLSVSNWNNLQFFLSEEWIEMYNTLENSTLEEWLPISYNIWPNIQSHSESEKKLAKSAVFWNKMWMSIWDTIYVYNIEQSAKKKTNVWTIYKLPYAVQYLREIQGKLHIWMNNSTYLADIWNTDDGTNIEARARIGRSIQKDANRGKNYFRGRFEFESTVNTCNVAVYVAYAGWTQELLTTVNIQDNSEISTVMNRIAKDVDVEFRFTSQEQPEFISGDLSFEYLNKI